MKRLLIAIGMAAPLLAPEAPVIGPHGASAGLAELESLRDYREPTLMPLPLKVEGTHVVDSQGHRVRLRGVNVACLEWTSDGEHHILDTVTVAIRDWHVNHI